MDKSVFHYQTSEKVKIEYEIAGMPLRLAAFALDIAIRVASFFAIYFVMLILFIGGSIHPALSGKEGALEGVSFAVMLVIYIIFMVFLLSYHLIFEWAWKGQTPGKRVLRIRAVNDDGTFMSFTGVLLRNIFRIVDMLPAGYAAGLVAMRLNKKRKRIGDYAAGTIVIRERAAGIPKFSGIKSLDCFSEISDAQRLFSPHMKSIIENYFRSRDTLDSGALAQVERELVSLIEQKTGVLRQDGISNNEFIGGLYLRL
jgi:uncharacterized RDD family membrane protein YckC